MIISLNSDNQDTIIVNAPEPIDLKVGLDYEIEIYHLQEKKIISKLTVTCEYLQE